MNPIFGFDSGNLAGVKRIRIDTYPCACVLRQLRSAGNWEQDLTVIELPLQILSSGRT